MSSNSQPNFPQRDQDNPSCDSKHQDLGQIFRISIDFDKLKIILSDLLNNQALHAEKFTHFQNLELSQNNTLDELQLSLEEKSEQTERLKIRINKLEDKQCEIGHFQKAESKGFHLDMKSMQQSIEQLQKQAESQQAELLRAQASTVNSWMESPQLQDSIQANISAIISKTKADDIQTKSQTVKNAQTHQNSNNQEPTPQTALQSDLDTVKNEVRHLQSLLNRQQDKEQMALRGLAEQVEELSTEQQDMRKKMEAGMSQLTSSLKYQKQMILDQSKDESIDQIQKRLKTLFEEQDMLRFTSNQHSKFAKRLDAVETKTQDAWLLLEEVKRSIPPSSEHMMHDLKQMNVSLQNFSSQTLQRFERVQEDIKKAFDFNINADLEKRMVERMNDIVKALTQQMADRWDTKKNLRILEKQIKNIFEVLVFSIQGGDQYLNQLLSAENSDPVMLKPQNLVQQIHLINQNKSDQSKGDGVLSAKTLISPQVASSQNKVSNSSKRHSGFVAWKKLPHNYQQAPRAGSGLTKLLQDQHLSHSSDVNTTILSPSSAFQNTTLQSLTCSNTPMAAENRRPFQKVQEQNHNNQIVTAERPRSSNFSSSRRDSRIRISILSKDQSMSHYHPQQYEKLNNPSLIRELSQDQNSRDTNQDDWEHIPVSETRSVLKNDTLAASLKPSMGKQVKRLSQVRSHVASPRNKNLNL